MTKGREDGVGWARPGGQGLRGGQKNGLDLCRSNNFIIMSEMGDRGEPTIDGTLQKV